MDTSAKAIPTISHPQYRVIVSQPGSWDNPRRLLLTPLQSVESESSRLSLSASSFSPPCLRLHSGTRSVTPSAQHRRYATGRSRDTIANRRAHRDAGRASNAAYPFADVRTRTDGQCHPRTNPSNGTDANRHSTSTAGDYGTHRDAYRRAPWPSFARTATIDDSSRKATPFKENGKCYNTQDNYPRTSGSMLATSS